MLNLLSLNHRNNNPNPNNRNSSRFNLINPNINSRYSSKHNQNKIYRYHNHSYKHRVMNYNFQKLFKQCNQLSYQLIIIATNISHQMSNQMGYFKLIFEINQQNLSDN